MPQKPLALNLNSAGVVPRRIDDRMPHVLPSPTIPPLAHKSPGSINFPRLNASPSHGPYSSAEWNDRRESDDRSNQGFSRSVSSHQLSKAEIGQYASRSEIGCPDRERFPSQVFYPSPAHAYFDPTLVRRMIDNRKLELFEFAEHNKQTPMILQGLRGGLSTLPKEDRLEHGRNTTQQIPSTMTVPKPVRKPVNTDSEEEEDEDWC